MLARSRTVMSGPSKELHVETWLIGLAVKPIIALVFFGLIVLPLKWAFARWFPESRIKRILLTPLKGSRHA